MEITNQNLLSGSDEESDFEGFSNVGLIDLESEGDKENGETNYENDRRCCHQRCRRVLLFGVGKSSFLQNSTINAMCQSF